MVKISVSALNRVGEYPGKSLKSGSGTFSVSVADAEADVVVADVVIADVVVVTDVVAVAVVAAHIGHEQPSLLIVLGIFAKYRKISKASEIVASYLTSLGSLAKYRRISKASLMSVTPFWLMSPHRYGFFSSADDIFAENAKIPTNSVNTKTNKLFFMVVTLLFQFEL
jgi:hypothetical protein